MTGSNRKASPVKRLMRALGLRKVRRAWAAQSALRRAFRNVARFPRHENAPRHSLPGHLIISLTSYPARFSTLHLTIRSILDQAVKADLVLLWIAHDDLKLLPQAVRALEGERFRVAACDDMRNFKKILPTLADYPDSFILIADDDTYYPDDWLAGLVDSYDPERPAIVFYRGHRPRYLAEGRLAPYRSWVRNALEDPDGSTPQDILATGNGGVLYPPGSLPPQTADRELIQKLSATSDDVWLYFMRRLSGWPIKRVAGPKREFIEWRGTQDQSLTLLHRTGRKDEHLQAMTDHFGIPHHG